jgi:hypothetical protein
VETKIEIEIYVFEKKRTKTNDEKINPCSLSSLLGNVS